jgi:lysozyme family protein
VFDFGVNSGVSRSLNYFKATSGSTEKRIVDLCDARLAFLKSLKTWPTFGGLGQAGRDVKATALKMAKGTVAPLPPPPDIHPPKANLAAGAHRVHRQSIQEVGPCSPD